MICLIYGASGFCGRHIHNAMLLYCDVIGIGYKNVIEGLAYSDVTKYKNIEEDLLGCKPDYIIFAAGNKNRDSSYKELYRDNTLPIKHIFKAITKNNLRTRVIYISTDAVFSGEDKRNYDHRVPRPITNYGKTKYLGEQALEPTPFLPKIDYRIIRTSAVIGKGSLFLSWLQNNMMLDSFKVYDKQFLSPTTVELLTNAIIYIIENWEKVKQPIIHICGPRLSRYQFARMVKESNPAYRAIIYRDKEGDFCDTSMIPSEIQKKIIHKPMKEYLREIL